MENSGVETWGTDISFGWVYPECIRRVPAQQNLSEAFTAGLSCFSYVSMSFSWCSVDKLMHII